MENIEKAILNRTTLLLGDIVMEKVTSARVIIFGVGGVGSWCAESLVRSGIRRMTIVDPDRICITNVNRQAMANAGNVGRVKVDALKERLLEINPAAAIEAVQDVFSADTAERFHLEAYDYIIDAIDSLKDKIELIVRATDKDLKGTKLFSAMGAALKIDSTQIRVSEFWNVRGCPLGAILRKRMRQSGRLPGREFLCVWSPEVLPTLGEYHSCDESGNMFNKAQVNGTTAHITGIFGFTLAGLVLQDIYNKGH